MIYGYARVSTKGQDRYGNSLTDQETKLTAAGCEIIYKDSYTGTKMERPEFTKLLNLLQEGDTLVVTKLDRFARSAAGGVQTMQELVSRGVKVNILNMGVADSTPMGKLMITILLGFAEFERDMIVERTSIGKAVAKEKDPNWREGRKKKEPAEFTEVSEEIESGTLTVDAGCAKLGISRSTYYRMLKREVA